MVQEINPEMDMKTIRQNGGDCTDLMYRVLENEITIDELKDAVMYAFEYGTEEIEGAKIPYIKTIIENIEKVIKSGLVEVESVRIVYLNPDAKRKNILVDKFIEDLTHLSLSGIFADSIKWRYVDIFDSGKYLIEGDIGYNNGYELNVVISVIKKEDKDKVVEILRESEEWSTSNTENKVKEKKAFPVYNQKLAGFLMMSGYRLMGIEENKQYKGKNVFYFMESQKIRESIQIYFGNRR